MICATLAEASLSEMIKEASRTSADLVELRLDFLEESEIEPNLLKKIGKPAVATCMPEWEGGKFRGSARARAGLLASALPFVQYVTIELKAEKKLRDDLILKAKRQDVKVIIAHHDFERTPPLAEIRETLALEDAAGADVVKVACMPREPKDVLTLMEALAEPGVKTPVIALSMGELGRASRILSPLLGGFLTFAAAREDARAAPGQLTVDELSAIQAKLMEER